MNAEHPYYSRPGRCVSGRIAGVCFFLAALMVICAALSGCAGVVVVGTQMQPQTCKPVLPTMVQYVNDPRAAEWCAKHGVVVPDWGGCTTCQSFGDHRSCIVRLPGTPDQVHIAALADEALHVFGCDHVYPLGGRS